MRTATATALGHHNYGRTIGRHRRILTRLASGFIFLTARATSANCNLKFHAIVKDQSRLLDKTARAAARAAAAILLVNHTAAAAAADFEDARVRPDRGEVGVLRLQLRCRRGKAQTAPGHGVGVGDDQVAALPAVTCVFVDEDLAAVPARRHVNRHPVDRHLDIIETNHDDTAAASAAVESFIGCRTKTTTTAAAAGIGIAITGLQGLTTAIAAAILSCAISCSSCRATTTTTTKG